MIIFDRLQISDNGKGFAINARVNEAECFNDVYIDYIVIVTADAVSETNTNTSISDRYVYRHTFENNTKDIHLYLNPVDFIPNYDKRISTFSNDLFFVYVVCKGTPCINTPCRLDENTTLGVTFDDKILFQKAMNYTHSLADKCEIPMLFIDLILLYNGFKASIETEHYTQAIKFYNQIMDNTETVLTKSCGCHG